MPLQIPATELEAVVRAVARHPAGASISQLMDMPDLDFAKRTLQRRIDLLIEANRLEPRGEGRSRKYVIAEQFDIEPLDGLGSRRSRNYAFAEPGIAVVPGYVREPMPIRKAGWLSPEGAELREAVNRPLSMRTPVGYKPAFLDAYVPNETAYLSPGLKRHLAEIGQVGLSDLPAGTYLRNVMDRLLIDLSWNSSRLEGNTYSLLETQRLLELGELADGKAADDAQMILNHKAAIEMLADQAEEIGFNRYTVCNLHALLADNLMRDPAACGRVRSVAVGISGTVFHPLEMPQMIGEQFQQILEKTGAVEDAFEQAFFVMVHLPYLQPFEDVNKRTSRLAANIPLVQRNLCPLSFVDVSREDYVGGLLAVYELNRVEYLRDVFVRAYERSCERYSAVRASLGEPDPFRLRHRNQIRQFVSEAVLSRMDKQSAAKWIAAQAEREISAEDLLKFIEVVETELSSLHMGNIARYKLRPSEFEIWTETWR